MTQEIKITQLQIRIMMTKLKNLKRMKRRTGEQHWLYREIRHKYQWLKYLRSK